MNNLDNLESIWHAVRTDILPSSAEMAKMIKKFRYQKLKNKWLTIVYSFLLFLLISTVLFIVPFKLISTYIGGGLIAVTCLGLAVINISSLKRFHNLDDCSNHDFLAFIEQTRLNQLFYYKKTQVFLMAACLPGLVLYLYEPAVQHPAEGIAIYGVSLACMGILWFLLRPKFFKKHSEQLNAQQLRFENLLKQIK